MRPRMEPTRPFVQFVLMEARRGHCSSAPVLSPASLVPEPMGSCGGSHVGSAIVGGSTSILLECGLGTDTWLDVRCAEDAVKIGFLLCCRPSRGLLCMEDCTACFDDTPGTVLSDRGMVGRYLAGAGSRLPGFVSPVSFP